MEDLTHPDMNDEETAKQKEWWYAETIGIPLSSLLSAEQEMEDKVQDNH